MNSELLQVIEQIGREKGRKSDRDARNALVSATRKFNVSQPIEVKIDSRRARSISGR
jgi:hypothetical protein